MTAPHSERQASVLAYAKKAEARFIEALDAGRPLTAVAIAELLGALTHLIGAMEEAQRGE